MDIVVKGRKAEVTERFRKHVVEKLSRIERFDGKTMSLDVELSRERNPRQAERCDRIEITMRTRGPVVRAEACAADPYAALDLAAAKLEAQLRRAADRRRIHHGRHSPVSVAVATAALAELEAEEISAQLNGQGKNHHEPKRVRHAGPIEIEGDGPLVVREKTHSAPAMDLCQALYEMELVGHDFYLFVDAESKLPSVVYRRKGYDYGVIHLEENGAAHYAGGQAGAEAAAPADARMNAA